MYSQPTDGQIAARAFLAFEQGEDCIAVVQRLEITPGAVRELWEEYRELQELDPRPETLQKIEELDTRTVALEGWIHLLGETIRSVTGQLGLHWDPLGLGRL